MAKKGLYGIAKELKKATDDLQKFQNGGDFGGHPKGSQAALQTIKKRIRDTVPAVGEVTARDAAIWMAATEAQSVHIRKKLAPFIGE
jgi:hypothetical protein